MQVVSDPLHEKSFKTTNLKKIVGRNDIAKILKYFFPKNEIYVVELGYLKFYIETWMFRSEE